MNIPLKQYWNLLVDYLRPQQARVAVLAILLFSNIGLQLVNPQIMRRFIDTALAKEGTEVLLVLALLFIGVALMQQLADVAVTYFGENVGWTATNWLRYDLARHCLHLDMSFHNQHTPGEMIERIDGDISTLSSFFSQFVLQLVGNSILLIGILILLFREDVRLGLALTAFVVALLTIISKMRNLAVPHWEASRQASAAYFGFLEERLAGTEEIRACGAKAYTMRRSFELLRTLWQTTMKARLIGFSTLGISWFVYLVSIAATMALGAILYQSGALTLGSVYLSFHYTGMLLDPIERISREIERLQRAGAGIARIQEFLQIQSKIVQPDQLSVVKPSQRGDGRLTGASVAGPLAVTFEHVSFAYEAPEMSQPNETSKFALHDLSFRLEPGRVLGLLGRTGSGKTTLTRLLFRLYDPDGGRVCVSDVDVRELPLAELRQQVGLVTQNVQLFQATIRDNLTFFDRTVPDAEIIQVIQELGLTGWYQTLEQGLDTSLAAGGGGLSAGEAQLLALARVFLKNPGLVILDEASSRLDPATEQLIERAIDRLLQNRTAIIVAHRLATVGRADEIMLLDKGRILEYGLREQLAKNPNSHFYQLLQTGLVEVLA
jgi:ATP-binding cassette subfamily B protein/ATP-binding cassette subfamily C protein